VSFWKVVVTVSIKWFERVLFMGQSGGGFRVWWRELYDSDEDLDDNHLTRMAGRFSPRLRAWAKATAFR
jgi:hypothetical protein